MKRILVSGLINIETTLRVDGFPIDYAPVRYPFFGIQSSVSGVGYNIAKALHILGDDVRLLSLVGKDIGAMQTRNALQQVGLPGEGILDLLEHTAQSVILYDPSGRRQVHTDLKDIQETAYPAERFVQALPGCDLAVLCNINFSRPFLACTKAAGVLVATDLHAIASLDDEFNRDFMLAADILFMSHENLPETPETWMQDLMERYSPQIAVIGLGDQGALLSVRRDRFTGRFPAQHIRPVVNTIGAGDALFSAFVHAYLDHGDPYRSIEQAILYASYKIGATGAADGLLDAENFSRLIASKSGTRTGSESRQ